MNRYLILISGIIFFLHIQEVKSQLCGNNQLDLSYGLNDIAFSTEESFIAVGDYGKILKTDNGGINWKEVNSGTTYSLRKIQMVNSLIGYILGENGKILKTDDGGENWFTLKSLITDYPFVENIYFITPETGFVFGGSGKIFKTIDGGYSWIKKESYSSENLNSMTFVNDSTGFICGRFGTLLKTTNYGNTWIASSLSSLGYNINLIKVVFTSDNIGYLLNCDGMVIKTTDGGDTWSKVGQAYTDYPVSMKFLNKNIGYILGGWNSPSFFRTMNGGLTWQNVNINCGGSLSGIAFNQSWTKGVVVGYGTGLGYNSQSGRLILYFDQVANTWKKSCYLDGSLNFQNLLFTDSVTAYLTGNYYQSSGVIFKTKDRGITWNQLQFYSVSTSGQIWSSGKDTLVFAGDSTYRSIDGGLTWHALTKMIGKYYFNGKNGCIQDFYSIYNSENMGKTWNKVLSANTYLMDMAFKDPANGFAVGYFCAYTSADSGKVWNSYTALPYRNYSTIYFLNKQTGFVGGRNGLLYRTSNGGSSWDSISSGITNLEIIDIKFSNDTLGYLIANHDGGTTYLYSSYNKGNSWQVIQQIGNGVKNVIFDSNGNLYLPGEGGVLNKFFKGSPPCIVSTLKGPRVLLKNNSATYSTFHQTGSVFNWDVSPKVSFDNFGDSIRLNFPKSGTYEIFVTPSNDCGIGTLRKTSITVLDSFPTIPPISTDISGQKEKFHFYIYPNPFINEIHTLVNEDGNYKISLYNMYGKLILEKSNYRYINQDDIILTSNLEPGIYFLEMVGNKKKFRSKLVKLK